MNELYDKILEYIRLYGIKQSLDSDSNFKSKTQEDIAKDIAEICKAEDIYWKREFERVENNYEKIWIENKELKAMNIALNKLSVERIETLEAKLSANRFIFNTFERHKYQDKITELEEKISILEVKAVARNGRIMDLEEEIATLQENFDENREELLENRDTCDELIEKIDKLESKLADIKYLDRQEVENAVFTVCVFDDEGNLTDSNTGELISAICSLAIKPIDKDKIYDLLFQTFSTWSMPQTGTSGLRGKKIIQWYKEFMQNLANEILKEE